MNILFCKTNITGRISGADQTVVNYAIELKKSGHQTSLLLIQPPIDGDSLVQRLTGADVAVTTLSSSKISSSLDLGRKFMLRMINVIPIAQSFIKTRSRKVIFRLFENYYNACCKYLMTCKPDLVHVITPDYGAVMLIRAANSVGIPVVYQEMGIPFHPPGYEDVYERFVSVLPLCDGVAALSPRLARMMSRVSNCAYKPVVLPLISPKRLTETRDSDPSSETVCFGFAGRLEHLKGPLQLIEAFRNVHRKQPAVKLKIAGDGSLLSQISTMVRHFGLEKHCQFTGTYQTLEERSRFMESIDVFVLPSLTEGTPNVIIEAMAHKKPIIATDVGGIPDLVPKEVGILIPAMGTKSLEEAIIKLANDRSLRESMGTAALERYERIFTSEAVLPLLNDFYRQTIAQYRARENGKLTLKAKENHLWSSDKESEKARIHNTNSWVLPT